MLTPFKRFEINGCSPIFTPSSRLWYAEIADLWTPIVRASSRTAQLDNLRGVVQG